MRCENVSSRMDTTAIRRIQLLSFASLLCLLMSIVFFVFSKDAHAKVLSTRRSAASLAATLTIENPGNLISQTLVNELQGVFDYSYPKLIQRFGSPVPQQVTLTVYSSTDGTIAGTAGNHVYINAVYQNANPDDLGWFTHELTHVAQSYSGGDVPGWFTEGLADYGRYYYAPPGANPSWWLIPGPPASSDSYTTGSGPAARFLIWLQQHKSSTIVDQLNHAAQTQQPFATVFQQVAGETVDQAWTEYTANPSIIESGTCQAGLRVSYSATQWSGAFTASLTLQNTGSSTVNGWSLAFTFPGSQALTQGWNGNFSQQGSTVTVTNAAYNGSISAGSTIYLGFNGSWNGSNSDPTTFTLNGQPCTVFYS